MPDFYPAFLFAVTSVLTLKLKSMQELIDKLKAEAGLTDDQATKALSTIKSYIIEKFPMLEGMVGNFFGDSEKD